MQVMRVSSSHRSSKYAPIDTGWSSGHSMLWFLAEGCGRINLARFISPQRCISIVERSSGDALVAYYCAIVSQRWNGASEDRLQPPTSTLHCPIYKYIYITNRGARVGGCLSRCSNLGRPHFVPERVGRVGKWGGWMMTRTICGYNVITSVLSTRTKGSHSFFSSANQNMLPPLSWSLSTATRLRRRQRQMRHRVARPMARDRQSQHWWCEEQFVWGVWSREEAEPSLDWLIIASLHL